jgi:hypothetical protein
MKYLGISFGTRRIKRKKCVESKIQIFFETLNKSEYSELGFNQMINVIRYKIASKMYYLFVNNDVRIIRISVCDKMIRNINNRFVKGQKLQKWMMYANMKNGNLGLPNLCDK